MFMNRCRVWCLNKARPNFCQDHPGPSGPLFPVWYLSGERAKTSPPVGPGRIVCRDVCENR